jgi:NADH-quinone oxidoreductase subunit H
MFFLGEYVNMFTVSALATTMFLGGWQAPPGIAAINDGMFNEGWWGFLWFFIKLWAFMWFFVWLRGSLPRVRYDQFMRFGWKFLIPGTLAWVVVVAFLRAAQKGWIGGPAIELGDRRFPLVMIGFVVLVGAGVLLASWVWDNRKIEQEARRNAPPPEEIDPFAGGYPVPPMPGQRLKEPSLAITDRASDSTEEATRA